jgi:outer membrane lipoprotein-sorting protein
MLHSNRKTKTEPTFIMNKSILFAAVSSVLALTLTAADSGPREEIAKAAAKLANSASYSWHTTVKVPEDSQFKPGPTDGKIEKGGFTVVKMSFNNNESEMVIKGEKAALSGRDGGWQLASELENAEGPGRFRAMMARNFRAPAAQVTEILSGIKELKKDGDTQVISPRKARRNC